MAEPIRVRKLGNGLLVIMDDKTTRTAQPTQGDNFYIGGVQAPPEPQPPVPTTRFIWPFPLELVNPVVGEFGPRWGRLHAGLDFGQGAANQEGTPIPASSSGTVFVAGVHGGYGNAVVLDHGQGLFTLYGHMAPGSMAVSEGQTVVQGQTLGGCGNTGASKGVHLHFETHENGYRWNASAVNPRDFIPKWNG